MVTPHASQSRPRYEFKYVVDARTASLFQQRLRDSMQLDPHATGGGYRVNSVYFDTEDLRAYFEKLDGVSPRYKVRLRYYGQPPSQDDFSGVAAFLEAKHRINRRTAKNRLRISGRRIPELVEGPRLACLPEELAGAPDDEASHALNGLLLRHPLQPFCMVSYHRKPLLCRIAPTLRVTFDTDLRVRGPSSVLWPHPEDGHLFLPRDLCIVEIKFHWAMPLWLLEICRECGLQLRRYSKYCSALERLYPSIARRQLWMKTGAEHREATCVTSERADELEDVGSNPPEKQRRIDRPPTSTRRQKTRRPHILQKHLNVKRSSKTPGGSPT